MAPRRITPVLPQYLNSFFGIVHLLKTCYNCIYRLELSRFSSSGDTNKKRSVCERFAPANRN